MPEVWKQWVREGEVSQWPTGESLGTDGAVRRYETTETLASDAFRAETFERYGHACAMTSIREESLLDLAHILPRSQHPDIAEHPEDVLVLNTHHHRAFDAALFTVDSEYWIRTGPLSPHIRSSVRRLQRKRVNQLCSR